MTPTELNSQLNLQHKAHLLTSLPGRFFPLPSSLKLPLYLTVCLLGSSINHPVLSSSFHVFTLLQIYFMDPFLQLKSVGTTYCFPSIWPSTLALKWMKGWKAGWWAVCTVMWWLGLQLTQIKLPLSLREPGKSKMSQLSRWDLDLYRQLVSCWHFLQ